MLRSIVIFVLIIMDNVEASTLVCHSNFEVNCINVVSYLIIDLIPIFIIFYLHWKNFRSKKAPESNEKSGKLIGSSKNSSENVNNQLVINSSKITKAGTKDS